MPTRSARAGGAGQRVAENTLRSSRYTLTEVTFLTGFSEQSAFNRAFKRWTGRTPTVFREAGEPQSN